MSEKHLTVKHVLEADPLLLAMVSVTHRRTLD